MWSWTVSPGDLFVVFAKRKDPVWSRSSDDLQTHQRAPYDMRQHSNRNSIRVKVFRLYGYILYYGSDMDDGHRKFKATVSVNHFSGDRTHLQPQLVATRERMFQEPLQDVPLALLKWSKFQIHFGCRA